MQRVAVRTAILLSIMSLCATQAGAATLIRDFSFLNAAGSTLASGSFGYDLSDSGILGFADLSSFSITEYIDGSTATHTLAYVNTLTPGRDDSYFGYDTSSNTFVPGISNDALGPISTILAADHYDSSINWFDTGIFIEPLPGQPDPAGTGTLGYISVYPGFDSAIAASFTISAVPEPSTWLLMLAGVGMTGATLRWNHAKAPTRPGGHGTVRTQAAATVSRWPARRRSIASKAAKTLRICGCL